MREGGKEGKKEGGKEGKKEGIFRLYIPKIMDTHHLHSLTPSLPHSLTLSLPHSLTLSLPHLNPWFANIVLARSWERKLIKSWAAGTF